jgi:hypothetical protein
VRNLLLLSTLNDQSSCVDLHGVDEWKQYVWWPLYDDLYLERICQARFDEKVLREDIPWVVASQTVSS